MVKQYGNWMPIQWIGSSSAGVAEIAREWLIAPVLGELVAGLGGPYAGAGMQAAQSLSSWTAAVLDTRRGAERREARSRTLPVSQRQLVIGAAGPLGLLETAGPNRGSYDCIVILGAATTGNKLRTRLARNLTHYLKVPLIVAVAADRPLTASEHASDPESMNDGTEWRHLQRCIIQEFGPLTSAWRDQDSATGRDFAFSAPGGIQIRFLIAPPLESGRRSTTRSQLGYLRERIPARHRRTCLLVTNSIYVPYQFFAGVPELLTDGIHHVEMVGTPTSVTGDPDILAQRLLQEIHSAVDAAVNLV